MPWKGEKDPYKIWLSEIILQQTRVDQGWAYYNRFVSAFPDVKRLARAPEEKVFKLWEGLGYYTRCKNLIATAKYIAAELDGKFPDNYDAILGLKGVGPYTAAAIGSFAFNLPHAVVDGNVFRVLSRFFGIDTATDSTTGKKMFTQLAQELLDKKQPGIYNQAIMDFGAIICKPQNPLCAVCPLKNKCSALLQDRVNELPVKEGKLVKRNRWFYYFIASYKNKVYVQKRGPKEIWENLYEFILFEADKLMDIKELQKTNFFNEITGNSATEILDVSGVYKQQLTHQILHGRFIQLKLEQELSLKGYQAITASELKRLPFPKFITGYLAQNALQAFER